MARILNLTLYRLLQQRFGTVWVANDGERMTGRVVTAGNRLRYAVLTSGEYYRVNCPFCNDTRGRLWINHRWGVGVGSEVSHGTGFQGDPMWWAATCYNENCLESYTKRKQLAKDVWDKLPRERSRPIEIDRGETTQLSLTPRELPGQCVALRSLNGNHHAIQYLRTRGLDPLRLNDMYGVVYCESAPPPDTTASGRLVFPIHMYGNRVGWQARYVGDLDWKKTGVPKYYTQRQLHVKQTSPFCIVVEGVTDAIAIGPGAVALYGKSMSNAQFDMLSLNWRQVVVMLDNDAYKESEANCQRLQESVEAVRVQLPSGFDPAKAVQLDADYVWDLIYASAVDQKITLGRPQVRPNGIAVTS
jgi:hypothetical protein